MITAYYKLVALSKDVKEANKIKSDTRLDCVMYTDNVFGGYKGLREFVNKKGQMSFYLIPAHNIVEAEHRRTAEWVLNAKSQNLSSIYIWEDNCPEVCFGYPNPKSRLANGSPNPMHPFRNDLFLFVVNTDYTEIEIFVIKDGRNLISSNCQIMIDGGFDDEVRELRQKAKPFFNYNGLSL